MLSTGLGRAVASIRPTIYHEQPHSTDFNLVILDWRFKTYYAEPCYLNLKCQSDTEDFRHTSHSVEDFFAALNPNSISSLDFDFDTRYTRPRMIGSGEKEMAIRQSRSLKALRLAHFRCTDQLLLEMFTTMALAGFRPKALSLFELYNDSEGSITREKWHLPCGMLDELEYLELTRFSGMFNIAAGAICRTTISSPPSSPSTSSSSQCNQQLSTSAQIQLSPSTTPSPLQLKTLKLTYNYKQLRESASEAFIIFTIPLLSKTLTTLKLVDTDHTFLCPSPPRRRTRYDAIYGHIESPLESLTNLHTLILTGDIATFLLADRFPQIISALKHSLVICDLCFPSLPTALLSRFLEFEKLKTLVLREWNWEDDDPRLRYFRTGTRGNLMGEKKLTVETVKRFWESGRLLRGPDGRIVLGLRELGIAGGFLEVAGGKSWGALRRWGERRGGRFWWGAGEMPKVG